MKSIWRIAGQGLAFLSIIWVALLLAGCQTDQEFQQLPGLPAGATTGGTGAVAPSGPKDALQVGDQITINFQPVDVLAAHQETIKEDGSITPPVIGPIIAANKSPGALQRELQQKYNEKFTNVTVTLQTPARYYYVTGEVKAEGPKNYLGDTDIIKAISSAGGLSDFAARKRIQLTRTGTRRPIKINYNKALVGDPEANLPVYPGDRIFVPRRWF